MLRLGISINGEGGGHITRMIALAEKLKDHYEIYFWTPKSCHNFLKFYFPQHPIFDLPAFDFYKKNHVILYNKTFFLNLKLAKKYIFGDKILIKQLKKSKINLIISDYEPFLPKASLSLNIPVLYFSHQPILSKHPKIDFEYVIAFMVNKIMMPNHFPQICCSFYNGDVGPMVRNYISQEKTEIHDYVLVYASPSVKSTILPVINEINDVCFKICPDPQIDFAQCLAKCRAVIAPAGHQLMTECLIHNKPLLAFPQKKQYEQRLNAIMLEKSGRGMMGDIKNMKSDIIKFLNKLGSYPFKEPEKNTNFVFKNDINHAVCIINDIIQKKFNYYKKHVLIS